MNFKEAKSIVRNYLRSTYTDRDLVRALDHARELRLAYDSCCCFAGIPGAGAELHGARGANFPPRMFKPCSAFYFRTHREESDLASDAYFYLAPFGGGDDANRRRILIPMILAEMRRRMRAIAERAQQPETCMACVEER